MAHIIEVIRNSEAEARSFLDALFCSDSVSAIARINRGLTRLPSIGTQKSKANSMREYRSSLETGKDLGETAAYCRLFPTTVLYNDSERQITNLVEETSSMLEVEVEVNSKSAIRLPGRANSCESVKISSTRAIILDTDDP